jgi:multiple sugar transport system ATP-binding protein
MASIKLENVHKVYSNGQVAVQDLNLEVADGELVVLVGPSGCGKTTILRIVAGLEEPTHGRVFLDGREVTAFPPHERDLAMVFQTYALYPHKTVRDNLAFGLRMRRARPEVINRQVEKAARVLDLAPLLERRPGQLSGGQRQRVALGRAIVREPKAFLFDEPLSNLDAQLRVQTRSELSRLHRQLRATMLYVTHDQEEAMTLGDRLGVLRDGILQQLATPLEIYRRSANCFVGGFIGSPAMNFFPGMLRDDGAQSIIESKWFTLRLKDQQRVSGRGGKIMLGVRPHDIRLTDLALANAAGRVDVIQPLGRELLLHLRVSGKDGDAPVTAVVTAETKVGLNEQVGIDFASEHLHLFDAQDGRRLN